MNDDDEISLWTDCVFVFDSSALLNFYEYSSKTQNDIFDRILDQLTGRLWVPHQVKEEYLRNRQVTLKKPASKYRGLLEKDLRDLKSKFVEIKNLTKTDERHPFIEQNIFSELESSLEKFEKVFTENVNNKISEINDYEKKDFIFEKFEKIFMVGEDYSFEQTVEIVKEGDFRYKNKIPPGYSDEDEKLGFRKFGDLIAWKQIIDFARDEAKSIILVNDDKKEDWWVKSYKEILGPREELMQEVSDVARVKFWMYTSSEFLERANKILKAKLDKETIREVKVALINTLKTPDWEGLLVRSDIIMLTGYQFARCRHPHLKHIVSIVWYYRDYKLILTSYDKPEVEAEIKWTYDLEKYSYLLLNPHMETQRWLYKTSILEGKINLELLSGPNIELEIIDQQIP